MRISVLLIDFPAQAYLRDLLAAWTRAGHEVTFVRSVHAQQDDTAQMRGFGFDVIDIDVRDWRSRSLILCDRMMRKVGLARSNFFLRSLARRCAHFPMVLGCDLLIGVEKAGLIVAASLAGRFRIPYVYYSLELYIEDHPAIRSFAHLRLPEKVAHAGASATLVQDSRRAAELARANNVSEESYVLLPIGSSGLSPTKAKPRKTTTFIALYIGVLRTSRRLDELIAASSRLGADELLHLHGPRSCPEIPEGRDGNLLVTTGMIDESQLEQLVAEADIGLALYSNQPTNDRLTAFSSHKIALYLKHGKPIVVPRNESYADLLDRFHCGEMIDTGEDLAHVVTMIRSNYASYSAHALDAFRAIYDIDANAPLALDAIWKLVQTKSADALGVSRSHGQ